jgi:hypothetical protein
MKWAFLAFTSAGLLYWYETMDNPRPNLCGVNDCPTEVRNNGYRGRPRLHGACTSGYIMSKEWHCLLASGEHQPPMILDGLGDQWNPIYSSATCAETIP